MHHSAQLVSRALPAAISNALATPSSQQLALSITIQDLWTRLSLFQGPGGGTHSGRSAAILTGQNTLLRAVVAQAADPNSITVQRITSPATPSSWQSASIVAATTAKARAGCALAVTGSTIRLFFQQNSDSNIVYVQSTDDGQTWGAPVVVGFVTGIAQPPLPLGNFCYGIAPGIDINTVFAAFASFDPNGLAGIFRATHTTSWQNWANEGPPPNPQFGITRGLASTVSAGVTYFTIGTQLRLPASGIAAAAWNYTAGAGAWPLGSSHMTPIANMDSPASGLSIPNPTVHVDPSTGTFYAGIRTVDSGSVSGTPASRTTIFRSTDGISYHPWVSCPANVFQFEVHCMAIAGQTFVFDGQTCYVITSAPPATDVSDDLLALHIAERPDEPTTITIELDNSAGQYTAATTIRADAQVTIALGYNGSTIPTHVGTIDAVTVAATPEARTCTIQCRDLLRALDYPSDRTILYPSAGQPAMTLAQIVFDVLAQAGVPQATLPLTSQFSQTVPSFIIRPGTTWLAALKRLASLYGFTFRADATPQVIVSEPTPSDPSSWLYSSEVLGLSWQSNADQANIIHVVGSDPTQAQQPFADAFDVANLLSTATNRYALIVDKILNTAAKCQIRANLALLAEQRGSVAGQLVVALNPTHEKQDVIAVTDAAIGLVAQKGRIQSIQWIIDLHTLTYQQHIVLSGV